jgi:O-antigen/teichoic acid export membrane protein
VNPRQGLTKSFLFLMTSNVLSPIFSMVLVLTIIRLCGVEMLGKYSLMMTVFVVGQSCATLGLPIIITREVAKARHLAGYYFVNACALTGGLIALALLALVPAMCASVTDAEMRVAISLTLVSLVPSVVLAYGEGVLLALERAGDYVTVGIAENVVRAGVGTVLVFLGFGVAAIAGALLILRILAGIVLLLVLRHRGVALVPRFDRVLWHDLLVEVPVVGAIPIVNQIYARSDILLLTWFASWRDVGLYSAGLRLVDLARTLPAAYSRALYPILAHLYGQRAEEFTEVAQQSLRHCLLMVAPLTIAMCGLSPVLITTFYGAKAAGGEMSLAILSWGLIPLAIACMLAQSLFAAGRQAIDLRVNVIATVLSLSTNALLIPWLGAVGAAIASLVSVSVYAALQYFWVRQHVLDPSALMFVTKLVTTTLASVTITAALLQASAPAAAAAGLMTYALTAFMAGLVTRRELDAFRTRIVSARARYLWGAP